jgi:hypothetical protein
MRRASTHPRYFAALALAVLALVALAAPAQGQQAPVQITPESETVAPDGFRLSAREAVAIADRHPDVVAERRRGPLEARPVISGPARWEVNYVRVKDPILVEVDVDGNTGEVLVVWTGHQARDYLARGHLGGTADNPWVWLGLAVLFLAPFVDPRRLLRRLHLDLLVLLSLGVSYALFTRGEIGWSVPLVYPALLYLFWRLLTEARRDPDEREPLMPYATTRILVIGLVLLVGARLAVNVTGDTRVIDVGFAGVVGADRVAHAEELYADNEAHPDTYGPLNYVAYTPFEALLPYEGDPDDIPAAHAATVMFDLLVLALLFVLGTRMRAGPEGRRLGLALAWGWAAYPFTLFALTTMVNDALVAALLVAVLLALRRPALRGALLGVATATKFAPAALLALTARATRADRARDVAIAVAAFTAILVFSIAVYLPDGGVREFYDTTIGFQLGRESIFSPWGLHPELGFLQLVVEVAALAVLAATFFLVPATFDLRRTAALAGAAVIAVQLPAQHWFYFYVLWFLPLALPALFGAFDASGKKSLSRG